MLLYGFICELEAQYTKFVQGGLHPESHLDGHPEGHSAVQSK